MSIYNPLGVRAENGGYIRANRNGDVITSAPSTLPYPTLVPASASNDVGSVGTPWMNGYFSGQVQAANVSATTVSATTVSATNFVGAIVPSGNFLPITTSLFDIGSTLTKWKDIYYSGILYGGGAIFAAQVSTVDVLPATNGLYDIGTNATRYRVVYSQTVNAGVFASNDGVTVRIGDATTSPNASFAIAIGPNAANAATAAISFPPIAIGQSAMSNSAGGSNNIALGMFAGQYIGGTDNFCAGYNAGKGDIGGASGSYNVCIGRQSNLSHTTGTANISIGSNTNRANTTGIGSVFIGHSAGNGGLGSFPVASCVGIGYQALTSITTGATGLTAVGYNCLTAVTSGTALTALGYTAGSAVTTSANSTFIGYAAGLNCTGGNNTFLGCNAGIGAVASTATDNIGIGFNCLGVYTTGSRNVAIGVSSLPALTTGTRNVIIGTSAGALLAAGTDMVAIGDSALTSATNATDSIAIGTNASASLTVGGQVAIGRNAGQFSTGTACIYIGSVSGTGAAGTNTGSSNTVIGTGALTAVTSGANNACLGGGTGAAMTTGLRNTLIGVNAGSLCTTNADNTMIGYGTTCAATGGGNTIVGSSSLISTPVNLNCVLGASNSVGHSNCIVLGTNITTAAASRLYLGSVAQPLGVATGVGAAGGATALPATPVTYLIAYVNGTQYKIPLYNP